jgi:hypothetical protein
MDEVWKSVVGWDGLYEVSNMGRVRSLPRVVDGGGFLYQRSGRILRERVDLSGRPRVSLCRDAKAKDFFIHALVSSAFSGPRPEPAFDACHSDGDPRNNRLDNLRWDTKKANQNDRFRHGTMHVGEKCHFAKLTSAQALQILADGRKQKDIAFEYGVTQQHISRIKRSASWGHIAAEKGVRFSAVEVV